VWVREYECVAVGGGVEIGVGVGGGVEIGVAVGGKCGCRRNVGVDCSLGLDMTIVEFLDFIPILKNLPYLLFVFKATVRLTSIYNPQFGGNFTKTSGGLTNLFYGCIE
jgi:hypothetical protein